MVAAEEGKSCRNSCNAAQAPTHMQCRVLVLHAGGTQVAPVYTLIQTKAICPSYVNTHTHMTTPLVCQMTTQQRYAHASYITHKATHDNARHHMICVLYPNPQKAGCLKLFSILSSHIIDNKLSCTDIWRLSMHTTLSALRVG